MAGLLLKLGLYGIIRFLLPIFPDASIFYIPFIYTISIFSIFYISLIVFTQLDFKKIIAYSSIVHMNFVLIGIFSGNISAVQGSMFLMLSHGFISSGMFILVGFLYIRFSTRLVFYYHGLMNYYPFFSLFFFLFVLGNLGLPGTGGFIGEFLIILGIFTKNIFVGMLSLASPFFCAIYSLILYVRIFHGISFNTNDFSIFFKSFRYVNVLKNLPYSSTHGSLNFKLETLSIEYYILLLFSFYNIYMGIFPKIYLNSLNYISYFIYTVLHSNI